jgi:hypothetical protein
VKPNIGSERSLEFIGAGVTSANTGSHIHTGCEVVCYLVDRLVEAGNKSVFGLIDWDGKHVPTDRKHVLAPSKRDGLENAILDPLLVTSIVLREAKSSAGSIGFSAEDTYTGFLSFAPAQLQPLVDRVQTLVLKRIIPPEEQVSVSYLGGFSLMISKAYLETDDHNLETLVLEAFPALRKVSRDRSGELMLHIARVIIPENANFLPTDLYDAFRDLTS